MRLENPSIVKSTTIPLVATVPMQEEQDAAAS
jgi:hypothetical protein